MNKKGRLTQKEFETIFQNFDLDSSDELYEPSQQESELDESISKFESMPIPEENGDSLESSTNQNRKNIPKITTKLQKGESVFGCNTEELVFVKWHYTKEVLILSNCHNDKIVSVKRE